MPGEALPNGTALKRVGDFLCRYSTLIQGRRVGVAVSGGSDSMALLHLLHRLVGEWQIDLSVLHFNHRLRVAEADADEQFVAEAARSLGLPFYAGHWDKAPMANLEAAARGARLAFFRGKQRELGLAAVATGHTRDDQAETVLFRLLRGTGPAGLAGILAVTDEGLVRPVLDCTRGELREYMNQKGLRWREDLTNLDSGFADRNRIRLQLLPQLREQWNPEISKALAQLATIAGDEESYWQFEMDRLLPGDLIFDRVELLRHPMVLRRRLMRAAIERAKGDLQAIEFHHIEQALALLDRSTGDGQATLPDGVLVERSFGQIRVSRGTEAGPAPANVTWREMPNPGTAPIRREMPAYNGVRHYLDAEKVTVPLTIRSWEAGDLFQPIGSRRPKRLKDLFQKARVPSWERKSWPMLLNAGTIVWTRKFGVAAGFEARPSSRMVVEVMDGGLKIDDFASIVESNRGELASITVG